MAAPDPPAGLTGRQARGPSRKGPARNIDLNSPWDLQLVGRSLYIAMAGPHQIWKLDLDQKVVGVFAGDGREGRRDGPLTEARFAQPSGITSDGKVLYTADSEANVIREIGWQRQVRRWPGRPVRVWRSGWIGRRSQLQHPLAPLVRR